MPLIIQALGTKQGQRVGMNCSVVDLLPTPTQKLSSDAGPGTLEGVLCLASAIAISNATAERARARADARQRVQPHDGFRGTSELA